MFSFFSKKNAIDAEEFQKYEHAKNRMRQKKRLFQHFVLFLVICSACAFLNLFLNIGENFYVIGLRWFVSLSLIWGFIFVLHLCNVWFFSKFMGKEWEQKHTQKLIAKQNARIQKIEDRLAKELKKKRPEVAELVEELIEEEKTQVKGIETNTDTISVSVSKTITD